MEQLALIKKEAENLIVFVENTYGNEENFKDRNFALYSLLQLYGEEVMKIFPTSHEA